MSHAAVRAELKQAGFPRVSGDEPLPDWMPLRHLSFSPRERG